jgi:two-component system cell cycle response regulator DivK
MNKILYVEDNKDNVFMVKVWLERRGFQVIVANNGQQGILLAQTEKPDLILMDISLPVIDGYCATQQLKDDPNTQAIPIIILTAHAMPSDKEMAKRVGADDFETKPVNMERLISKIKRSLSSNS